MSAVVPPNETRFEKRFLGLGLMATRRKRYFAKCPNLFPRFPHRLTDKQTNKLKKPSKQTNTQKTSKQANKQTSK